MIWISKIFHRPEDRQKIPGSNPHESAYERKNEKGLMVTADNPIRRLEDDAIGRAPAARSFARQVLELDASEGVVVGVLGAWGSGKTSFIYLARSEFDQAGVPILDFNPWMFSGAMQ